MAAKSPAKPKPALTDNTAQDPLTDTTTAVAAPAPGAGAADLSSQQDQPAEGARSDGEGAPAAAAAQSPAVLAERAAVVEPVAGGELVGTSANVAVIDEFEHVGEPWHGLQRAASDVILERLRQVHGEGFTLERDDAYTDGQLARAATCLLIPPAGLPRRLQNLHWPFAQEWLKPGLVRDDLVKAGALIFAEIERLDRAEAEA